MNEVILPDGWYSSKLENAISSQDLISDGDWIESKDQDINGTIRIIQLADIGDGEFKNKSERYITPEKAKTLKCTYLHIGDVLIARMPDPLGRSCIFPNIHQSAVTVVDICLIRTKNSAFNNKILKYWLNTPIIRSKIASNSSGTTRKRITRKKLEQLILPIPALPEQKVIADLLDQLIAQVDKLKLHLETILTTLKQFRQSVLNAAVTGKLTEDWRKLNPCSSINIKELEQYWSNNYKSKQKKYTHFRSNKYSILKDIHLPDSWVKTQVGEVFDVHVGATPSRSDDSYWNGNINWVSSAEVAFCRISSTKEKITQKGLSSCSTKVHPIGTVMLAMIGQGKTRGQAAILDTPACHNQNTAALRIAKKYTLPEFLYYYLMSQYQITRMVGSGNNQKALNKISVQELPFSLPPFKEQQEIVNRVENYFAFADKIEQQVKSAQERVNNLTPAVLAKAFKGELTADWRAKHPELISGENSAEALLKRIQAEQQALTKPTKTKKVKK